MTKVKKGKRIRAYRPKTRTGCLTCKIRRVKCDELQPACHNCTSTGRACDGYTNIQSPHSSSGSDPVESPVVVAGPSFDIQASQRSKRSFAFFVKWTCPQLAGFFGSDFWERLVLQAAHHEATVRHAIIAIGSLHELLHHQSVVTHTSKAFALGQYNIAIRELLNPLSRCEGRGVDLCLISCILFASFENMQGHHSAAILHIHSGVKLLQEAVQNQQTKRLQHEILIYRNQIDSYAPLETVARIFSTLDLKFRLLINNPQFTLASFPHSTAPSPSPSTDIPVKFSTLAEAKSTFDYGTCLFTHSIMSLHASNPAAVKAHITYCTALLSRFSTALQNFVIATKPTMTRREATAIAVLKLHVLNSHILFYSQNLPPAYRAPWSAFTSLMARMTVLGEEIISAMEGSEGSTSFCLDMGIIMPLHTVAFHCQDLDIRRKAISLLRSTARQEALWNSLLVAQAAERILQLEIEGSVVGGDVGYGFETKLELDDRGGRLKYLWCAPRGGEVVEMIEELACWG